MKKCDCIHMVSVVSHFGCTAMNDGGEVYQHGSCALTNTQAVRNLCPSSPFSDLQEILYTKLEDWSDSDDGFQMLWPS